MNEQVWNDTVLPAMTLILGIFSIIIFLGLDKLAGALVSSFLMTRDDFMHSMEQDLTSDSILDLLIPFDIKLLICMLICIPFRMACKKRFSRRRSMATTGMVMSIVSMALSFTPLGYISTLLPAMLLVAPNGDFRNAAEEDYAISDLHMAYSEYGWGYATACGTLTNTTEYNWEYAKITFEITDTDGEFGSELLSCRTGYIPAGESIEFESSFTFAAVASGCYEKCEVVSVSYDIDSGTGNYGAMW